MPETPRSIRIDPIEKPRNATWVAKGTVDLHSGGIGLYVPEMVPESVGAFGTVSLYWYEEGDDSNGQMRLTVKGVPATIEQFYRSQQGTTIVKLEAK